MKTTVHVPVLLHEIVERGNLKPGSVVFDGTLGGGGYTKRFSDIVGQSGLVVGTDLDAEAIERVDALTFTSPTSFHNRPFSDIAEITSLLDMKYDLAVLDLGLSSDQLELSQRGFSFKDPNEPLLMSFQNSGMELSAQEIVNEWSEESIADILYGFGGERFSRKIARSIIDSRVESKIETVGQLVEIIKSAVPGSYKKRKTHPATKTFQALRIATNSEWMHLNKFLEDVLNTLAPQGRVAIVSFHSGEDRVVKHTFRKWKEEGLGQLITKKALKPTDEEIAANPRSRSAILRVFEKN